MLVIIMVMMILVLNNNISILILVMMKTMLKINVINNSDNYVFYVNINSNDGDVMGRRMVVAT